MFANLDIVQVVLIGIGLVIVGSIFLKSKKEEKPTPTPTPSPVVPPKVVPVDNGHKDDSHNFMCLVHKWYDLKSCAHEQGLHDVCDVLDGQVFPLLNTSNVEPDEVQPDEAQS